MIMSLNWYACAATGLVGFGGNTVPSPSLGKLDAWRRGIIADGLISRLFLYVLLEADQGYSAWFLEVNGNEFLDGGLIGETPVIDLLSLSKSVSNC